MKTNFYPDGSYTRTSLHAKRYTAGELKGTWRGYVKVEYFVKDAKIRPSYFWTPDYMGSPTREDALKMAEHVLSATIFA